MDQVATYISYVTMLADSTVKDELKLKVAQELSENFEVQFGKTVIRLSEYIYYI